MFVRGTTRDIKPKPKIPLVCNFFLVVADLVRELPEKWIEWLTFCQTSIPQLKCPAYTRHTGVVYDEVTTLPADPE